MTEYVGVALIGLSLIGLVWRSIFLHKRAKAQRLHEAVQSFIDELVDLYDSKDDEPRA